MVTLKTTLTTINAKRRKKNVRLNQRTGVHSDRTGSCHSSPTPYRINFGHPSAIVITNGVANPPNLVQSADPLHPTSGSKNAHVTTYSISLFKSWRDSVALASMALAGFPFETPDQIFVAWRCHRIRLLSRALYSSPLGALDQVYVSQIHVN